MQLTIYHSLYDGLFLCFIKFLRQNLREVLEVPALPAYLFELELSAASLCHVTFFLSRLAVGVDACSGRCYVQVCMGLAVSMHLSDLLGLFGGIRSLNRLLGMRPCMWPSSNIGILDLARRVVHSCVIMRIEMRKISAFSLSIELVLVMLLNVHHTGRYCPAGVKVVR